MAEYLVRDTSLTSVADAIRSKTGVSELLTFPDGYIEAINSIVGEGGSGLPDTIIAGDQPVLYTKATKTPDRSESLLSTGVSLTVPKNGTYRFITIATNTYSDSVYFSKYYSRVRFYKNKVAVGTATDIDGETTKSISADIECVAGDVVEVYASSAHSTLRTIIAGLVACIDWDIDWTGESEESNEFVVTVEVINNSNDPLKYYDSDRNLQTVATGTTQTIQVLNGLISYCQSSATTFTGDWIDFMVSGQYRTAVLLTDGTLKISPASGGGAY